MPVWDDPLRKYAADQWMEDLLRIVDEARNDRHREGPSGRSSPPGPPGDAVPERRKTVRPTTYPSKAQFDRRVKADFSPMRDNIVSQPMTDKPADVMVLRDDDGNVVEIVTWVDLA